MEDMRHACDGARTHMLRRVPKQPSLSALYTLSSHATHEAVHLLCQMLVFDPVSFRKLISLLTVLLTFALFFPRTREYQSSMLSLIRISTKVDYVTILACVSAAIPHRAACVNTRLTLSPQPLNHLMISGKESWLQCNRSKVSRWSFPRWIQKLKVVFSNRGNAQVHRRATADRTRSTMHKPTVCRFQKLRQVSEIFPHFYPLPPVFLYLLLLFWVVENFERIKNLRTFQWTKLK